MFKKLVNDALTFTFFVILFFACWLAYHAIRMFGPIIDPDLTFFQSFMGGF